MKKRITAAILSAVMIFNSAMPVAYAEETATPSPSPTITVRPTTEPTATHVVTPTAQPTENPEVTTTPQATPTSTAQSTENPEVTATPQAAPTPTAQPTENPEITATPEVTSTPENTEEKNVAELNPDANLSAITEEAEGYALDAAYIYFDLHCGDVIINGTTYSGYRYDENGNKITVSGNHNANNKYYIYQSSSNKSGYGTVPQYDRITYNGKTWAEFITNNTDVLDVVKVWDEVAKSFNREESPAVNKVNYNSPEAHRNAANGNNNETVPSVPMHHRIIIECAANVTTNFNVTIDNVWSGFQNDDCRDTNGNLYYNEKYPDTTYPNRIESTVVHRMSGGISFRPNNRTTTANIYIKGDNRFGNIHYDAPVPANYDSSGYNKNLTDLKEEDRIHSAINQLIFHNGDSTENPGTMTVANLRGDTGESKFCSVIGGANDPSYAPGLVFNGGVIYAGATALDNCTAIGGGGCGFGGVTINGGTITAVTETNGTAIGGGIGDGGNGGVGNVTITGGNVYAYNNGIAVRGTRTLSAVEADKDGNKFTNGEKIYYGEEYLNIIVPAVAIGSGSSRISSTTPTKINISGGTVYAQSTGGTAIGGGSSNNHDGANAYINITGGEITAKSVAGIVKTIREYDLGWASGRIPDYVTKNNNEGVTKTRADAAEQAVSASTSIGGGTSGTPFLYEIKPLKVNGVLTGTTGYVDKIKDQQNGGNCILNISGNPKIYAGSIGGGGTNVLPTVDSQVEYADRYTDVKPGSIGSAQVEISGGTTQGQFIMAKNDVLDCSFNMTGGVIDNITKDETFVFLQENGGAVYVENGNATMSGGEIKNCDDAKLGGIFYVEGGNVTMTGGTLKDSSSENGGAVYVNDGSFKMTDEATPNGGALITGCMATNGAAAYIVGGDFVMEYGEISNNGSLDTTEYGGAVYVSAIKNTDGTVLKGGNATVGLSGCTLDTPIAGKHDGTPPRHPIISNNAAKFGGGFAVTDGLLTIYCCKIVENISDNAGTGENIFISGGKLDQYINGTEIGKEGESSDDEEDHGIVMVGGDMELKGEEGLKLITIRYNSNNSLQIVWDPQAPLDYWINLPYCPEEWKNSDDVRDKEFVGWGFDPQAVNLAEDIRNMYDYKPIGHSFQIKDLLEHSASDDHIDLYAIWAPKENKITYAYSLNAQTDMYWGTDRFGNIQMKRYEGEFVQAPKGSDAYNTLFNIDVNSENNVDVPQSYGFTRTTTAVNVPTPQWEGYTFHGWLMYASHKTITNWNSDAYIYDAQKNEYILDTNPSDLSILYNPAKTVETPKVSRSIDAENDMRLLTRGYSWNGKVLQNFGDIVLVAVFVEDKANINYKVVAPDGTVVDTPENAYANITPAKQEGVQVDTVQALNSATVTAKAGYKIIGWYSDSGCGEATDISDWVTDSEKIGGENGYTSESTLTPTKEKGEYWSQKQGEELINPNKLWAINSNVSKETPTERPDQVVLEQTFYVKLGYAVADLVIVTTDKLPQNQSYIFTISGTPSDSTITFNPIEIVINGQGTRRIKDLPVGTYTVTEQDGWSWRYDVTANKQKPNTEINLVGKEYETVIFDSSTIKTNKWIDGFAYKANKFTT